MNRENPPAYVRRVLEKFQGVRPTRDGWDACCPCPDHNQDGDQHPSLRITVTDDGKVLIKCRVGCSTETVLESAGIDWPDLFDSDRSDGGPDENAGKDSTATVERVGLNKADPDLCHQGYDALLTYLPLNGEHRDALRRRGLPDPEIDRRGYRSLRNVDRSHAAKAVHQQLGDVVCTVPGFTSGEHGMTLNGASTGLLVPVRNLEGKIQALKIRREQEPKYVYLTGGEDGLSPGSPIHLPLGIAAPSPVIRVTEGELKADICTALDSTPTIGVPGVTQWRGAIPILKSLGVETVVLAFDAPDVYLKPPVFEQAEAFFGALKNEGFKVALEDWYEPSQGS